MALPSVPKKPAKDTSVTVRLPRQIADQLKELATAHNLSQAQVIEHLISLEWASFEKKKKK